MKKHEAAILAAIGGVGLYLFIHHKPFRKVVFQAWREYAKAVEERSDKPIIKGASTVGKKENDKSGLKKKLGKQ